MPALARSPVRRPTPAPSQVISQEGAGITEQPPAAEAERSETGVLDAVAGGGGLAAAPPDDLPVPAWLEEPLEGADATGATAGPRARAPGARAAGPGARAPRPRSASAGSPRAASTSRGPASPAASSGLAARAFSRGQELERQGENESAILAYEQAWSSTEADPDLHRRAGEALDRLRPLVQAFDRHAARDRTRGADELYAVGRYREALAIYQENQQHSRGHDPTLQLKLARCLVALGQGQAREILETLREARGLSSRERAEVEQLLTRVGPGAPAASETVDPPRTPEQFRAAAAAADANARARHHGAAVGLWLRLLESPLVGDQRGLFLFNIGMAYARMGVTSQAAAFFRRALTTGGLDPDAAAFAESYAPGRPPTASPPPA